MAPRVLALAAIVVLASCGSASGRQPAATASGAPTTGPTASASSSPTPSGSSQLFVALQARGPGSTFGGGPDAYDAHDVVAIVGRDGSIRAEATFKPRTLPSLGMAGTLMQPEARVAAGSVFYVDGTGVVRRLDPDGQMSLVTAFPAGGPQQEISFAVSPDGKQLIASILTLPTRDPNCGPGSGTPGCTGWLPGSHAFVELFAADAGGTAHSMLKTDLGTGTNGLVESMRVVGWDATGPLVTLRMSVGTQQGSLGNHFEGFLLAHLDGYGRPGPALTGEDCMPWQQAPDGAILCGDPNYGSFWLVDNAGRVQSKVSTPGQGALFLAISPDVRWVASHGKLFSLTGLPTETLPATFFPEGWLDGTTMIGYQDTGFGATVGNMALVRLSALGRIDDLGFRGVFVGNT